jgi:hypothetical protein
MTVFLTNILNSGQLPSLRMATGPAAIPTVSVQETLNEINSYIKNVMPEPSLTPEEVKELRGRKCVEVTVHAQQTEVISIEDIEDRFLQERGQQRVTVPSTDILQYHATLPSYQTTTDVFQHLTEEFNMLVTEKEDILQKEEVHIEEELQKMFKKEQSEEVTVDKIINLVFNLVNAKLKLKVQRELLQIVRAQPENMVKNEMMANMRETLFHSAENMLLVKDPKTKKQWSAIIHRWGQKAENSVAFAINQVMDQFWGISVTGLKTHSHLEKLLTALNINLTHGNPNTEVEHDLISTFLLPNALVVNFVQTKTLQIKPWAPPPDRTKMMQEIVSRVKDALKQTKKDLVALKEIFPDLTPADMQIIRY